MKNAKSIWATTPKGWSLITQSTSSALVKGEVGVGYFYNPNPHAQMWPTYYGTAYGEHRKIAGPHTSWFAGPENTDAFRFIVPSLPGDSQSYFWTESWQKGEREADEDIRLKRTRRFTRVRDAIAWLERPKD